jgi:hypothetical protein
MGKFGAQAIARLARAAAANAVREDDEILARVERLARPNSSSASEGSSQFLPVPLVPCSSSTPLTISPAALRLAVPSVV